MQIFRMVLKDKAEGPKNTFIDVTVIEGQSLPTFSQMIKSHGGFANDTVAVPYENILLVMRLDVEDPLGIDAPTAGSA